MVRIADPNRVNQHAGTLRDGNRLGEGRQAGGIHAVGHHDQGFLAVFAESHPPEAGENRVV